MIIQTNKRSVVYIRKQKWREKKMELIRDEMKKGQQFSDPFIFSSSIFLKVWRRTLHLHLASPLHVHLECPANSTHTQSSVTYSRGDIDRVT